MSRSRRVLPGLVLVALAGCASPYQPGYSYGPGQYAPVAVGQPVLVAPSPGAVSAAPLPPLPPPGTFLPDRPPPDPYASLPPLDPAPAPAPELPGGPEAAPVPSDPVTDLLLAPRSQGGGPPPATQAAAPEPPPPRATPEANPFMGFRPMRGQSAPNTSPNL